MSTSYWHRIEYYRIDRGQRLLDWVEVVDDQWPYLYQRKGVSRKDSAEIYARAVGEDSLDRWNRPAGRWVIVLWRLDANGLQQVTKLCEVELRWNGSAMTHRENRTAAA